MADPSGFPEDDMTNTDFGSPPVNSPTGGGTDSASIKDMAKTAVQTVKEETATFADSAKDKALDQVQQKKQVATETLSDFANAIRKAGDDLAQHDQSMVGRMVKQAAEGLEGLSRSVSDKNPEQLLDSVRDFGRSNPTAFIAGSVLLGLAIGRFAKSSEQHGDSSTGPTEASPGDLGSPSGLASGADGGQATQRLASGATAPGAPINPASRDRFVTEG
jgi:hypothetical protein